MLRLQPRVRPASRRPKRGEGARDPTPLPSPLPSKPPLPNTTLPRASAAMATLPATEAAEVAAA